MIWSHSESWMVTGDHAGYIKYWQSNMNNVKMFQAHKEAIRGLRYIHQTYVSRCDTLVLNDPFILAIIIDHLFCIFLIYFSLVVIATSLINR